MAAWQPVTRKTTSDTDAHLCKTSTSAWRKETSTDVLADLMRECNVSHWKKKQINDALKNRGSLPENLKPLNSCRTSKPAAWKPSSKKEPALTGPGKTFSGKKMQENILKDNPPQRERFRGAAPGRDLNAEKERLALIMQFKGKTPEEIAEGMKAEQFSLAATKKKVRETVHEDERETEEQIVDRLLAEVEERQEFLREMRDLGRGKEYEAKMLGEIGIKMRQINDIQRTHSENTRKLSRAR